MLVENKKNAEWRLVSCAYVIDTYAQYLRKMLAILEHLGFSSTKFIIN